MSKLLIINRNGKTFIFLLWAVLYLLPSTKPLYAQFIPNQGQFSKHILAINIQKQNTCIITDSSIIINSLKNKVELSYSDTDFSDIEFMERGKSYFNFFLTPHQINSRIYAYNKLIIHNIFKNTNLIIESSNDTNSMISYKFTSSNKKFAPPIPIFKNLSNHTIIHKKNEVNKIIQLVKHKTNNEKSNHSLQHGISDSLIYSYVFQSSYFGGSDFDLIRDAIVTDKNEIYMTGYTLSMDFLMKNGLDNKFDTSEYHYSDIFITKLDSSGKNVIFSTYLGSIYDDVASAIALDSVGNIYIAGNTKSYNFYPVTDNAFQKKANGSYDSFITRLSPAGDSLQYSTLFGGELDDYITDLEIDIDSNVIICGYSNSKEKFPYSEKAYLSENKGKYDGFVAKLNDTLSILYNSTYIGYEENDFVQKIGIIKGENPYFLGFSKSKSFPQRADNFYNGHRRGDDDIFIIQFDNDYNKLSLSTLIGGDDDDIAYSFTIDTNNLFHIIGTTKSPDFPITNDALYPNFNMEKQGYGITDIFYTTYSPIEEKIIYNTFLGGTAFDYGFDISLDKSQNPYLTGYTTSYDFPITESPLFDTIQSRIKTSDVFIMKLSRKGKRMSYSTFYGGDNSDVGHKIFVNESGLVRVFGKTQSKNLFMKNELDNSIDDKSSTEVFLLQFKPIFFDIIMPVDTITVCPNTPIIFNVKIESGVNNSKYTVLWNNSETLDRNDSLVVIATPETTTEYKIIVTDTYGNTDSSTIFVNVLSNSSSQIFGNIFTRPNTTETYTGKFIKSTNYEWQVTGGDITYNNSKDTIRINWLNEGLKQIKLTTTTDEADCVDSTILKIYCNDPFTFSLNHSGDTTICKGSALEIDAGDYNTYLWSDSSTYRTLIATEEGKYWCITTDANNNWGYSDTLSISTDTLPDILIEGERKVAQDTNKDYYILNTENFTYEWKVDNGNIYAGNDKDSVTIRWSADSLYGKITIIVRNEIGCIDSNSYVIKLCKTTPPILEFTYGSKIICEGDFVLLSAGDGYCKYLWSNGDTTMITKLTEEGTYWCAVTDINGKKHVSNKVKTGIFPKPPVPEILVNELEHIYISSELADRYKWYRIGSNGDVLVGTQREYHNVTMGRYYLVIFNRYGCSNKSSIITGINDKSAEKTILIMPNPNNGNFYLYFDGFSKMENVNIIITNQLGIILYNNYFSLLPSFKKLKFDNSKYPAGYYNIIISTPKQKYFKKFIIMK